MPDRWPLRHGQTVAARERSTAGVWFVVVSGRCVETREVHTIRVPEDGVRAWLDGATIAAALPECTPHERAFLLSGLSPAGLRAIAARSVVTR